MNEDRKSGVGATGIRAPAPAAPDLQIPELLAQVYEAAPAVERCHLLEQLLQPLSLLSLAAVAGGVFAKIRLRCGWQQLDVRLDDLHSVRSADVAALVDYAQQVSVETVDGLAQMLSAMPLLSGSAAAALLVAMLLRRAGTRGPAGSQES
jgi:hypothetical protein